MLLQKEVSDEAVHIKSYSKGKIILNIGEYSGCIFLTKNQLQKINSDLSFKTLTIEILDKISVNQPEIIVIGTGSSHKIMDLVLIKHLNDQGIALEAMASRQACHTYEVLAHDRRKVNALIFA